MINKLNSLSHNDFINKKLKYTSEDYNIIDNYSKLDIRFYEYIQVFTTTNCTYEMNNFHFPYVI